MRAQLNGIARTVFLLFVALILFAIANNLLMSHFIFKNHYYYNRLMKSLRQFYNEHLSLLDAWENGRIKGPTIFCMIITHQNSLDSKAKLMYETWAHNCDNYKVVFRLINRVVFILNYYFLNKVNEKFILNYIYMHTVWFFENKSKR